MRSKMLTVAIAAGLGLTSITTVSAQTSTKKVTVSAAELADMKAEIAALEQKVQDLESQSAAQTQAQQETAQSVQATQAQVQATQAQVAQAQQVAATKLGDTLGGTGGVKWTFGGFLAAESTPRMTRTASSPTSRSRAARAPRRSTPAAARPRPTRLRMLVTTSSFTARVRAVCRSRQKATSTTPPM
jgi:hypothetical protein